MNMPNTIEYDIDALRDNIIRCDNNIKTFEEAIEKEQEQKRELRDMIRTLEDKQSDNKV